MQYIKNNKNKSDLGLERYLIKKMNFNLNIPEKVLNSYLKYMN